MRFASLGSGSKGNCLVAEAGQGGDATRVLIDCGLAPRETGRRLARLGLAPEDIDGILVTHEHDDHAGHAFAFAAQHGTGVWMTHGTRQALLDAAERERAYRKAIEVTGHCDVFVYVAGLLRPSDGATNRWEDDGPMVEVNFTAAVHLLGLAANDFR